MADGNFLPIVKKKYIEKGKELSFENVQIGETFIASVDGIKFLGMLIMNGETDEVFVLNLSAPLSGGSNSNLGVFYIIEECKLLYMQQICIEEL